MYCLENDSWDSTVLLLGKTEVLLGTNWDSESQCKRLDVTAGPGNSANRKEEQGCGDTLGGGLEGFSGKKKIELETNLIKAIGTTNNHFH